MTDHDACPACGHDLSMFNETEMSSSERLATALADRVATWWFSTTIVTCLAVWIAVNLIWRPFEPYPVVVLAVISAVLASVAALQGPLILVSQRRAAERDRMRDREALRVAINAEADIHRFDARLGEIAETLDQIRGAR